MPNKNGDQQRAVRIKFMPFYNKKRPGALNTLFVSRWLTGRCRLFSIGSWEALKWPLPLWRVDCYRSSISFNFFRPGEIGLLYALNDYDFYRLYKMYYSLSVGNFQEALEDLHCVEKITGKSKFFLTLSLCLYILVRFWNCCFFLWIHRIYIPKKQVTL